MKKLISLLLALVMVFSLATVAFASEPPAENEGTGEGGTTTPINPNATVVSGTFENNKGSITINKYNQQNEYSLYHMLKLESFTTGEGGKYSYQIMPGWEDFFKGTYAQTYVTVDKDNYVTKKNAFTDTIAPEFAQKALEYAQAHTSEIQKVHTSGKAEPTGTNDGFPYYTFDNLDLGYYLVDSSMGSLCGLTTTNLHASINAKNGEPTLNKQVKEDSTGQWGTSNTADIGQNIEYRVTITVQAGAQDYILHDQMSDGLTFDKVTKVEYDGTDYTDTVGTKTHYEVVTNNGFTGDCANCDFHIVFTDDFCNLLSAGKSLIITYEATLNENAKIAGDESNSAKLEFGVDHFTTKKETTTSTYAFDLVKTDGQNFLLDGAKFKMYRLKDGMKENDTDHLELLKVFQATDDKGTTDTTDDTTYYRPALDGETGVEEFAVTGGIIRFQGFDPGDYYFEETVAPSGYNKLTEKAKFTLSTANKDAIFNADTTNPTIKIYSAGSGFHITNQSGAMLPETGATGTAMFIFFGMFVMLTTGVLLVTKKRMSMIEE